MNDDKYLSFQGTQKHFIIKSFVYFFFGDLNKNSIFNVFFK